MNLILTHEQADFDAVAAMLGAWLLDPGARAVLPVRVNRNVRAYLTLYRDQLPFVGPDDLAPGAIDRLTLVDTQILTADRRLLGGDRAPTPPAAVHVIDHHPDGSHIDPAWTRAIEPVGATTTILVEELEARAQRLDPSHATLLLLGIYEDTGSLSFSGTTPRDARAGAWLLENGANLDIAGSFLHPSLTEAQRRLYDRLFDAAEPYPVGGLTIVVAAAEADEPVEEISGLAHRLRDQLEPAGLFLLVGQGSNVQMVARSTVDALDVGRVAERFGGGGHARAAAALLRGKTPAEARQELLRLLPELVRPLPTVAEIMSRSPQVLRPDALVRAAARRMQQFGHEGYPVVDDQRVVGLITRRAVDRAMAHSLGDRPVSDFMQVGEISVTPQASIPHLQRLMMEHDWGQIPVVDADTRRVVGIVTRTDLLKQLASPTPLESANLRQRLEQSLPAGRLGLLRLAARFAEERRMALYIVGGFVRDLLLGLESADFDLVVEGDAIRLAEDLAREFGGRVVSHRRFGTAKWHLRPGHPGLVSALLPAGVQELPPRLDLVTARTEFYTHPSALPSVERGSIKLDLHRRDFTLNTLALRLDGPHYGQLLDPWGGGRDLQERLIRVLHSLSFVEDPTRILRAVRLEQRLDFRIEPRTMEFLLQARPLLDRVSGERIRNELELMFREPKAEATFERLQSLDLLQAIHPALRWDRSTAEAWRRVSGFHTPHEWKVGASPDEDTLRYAVWLAGRPPEEAGAAAMRLRMSRHDLRAVEETARLAQQLPQVAEKFGSPSAISAWLEGFHEHSLAAATLVLSSASGRLVERYLAEWRHIHPTTGGEHLRQHGLPAGPAYARILERLRAARIDGEVRSDDEEQRLLASLLKEEPQVG
jgi:tRNA nucleotidyltransferase (CCA-adding enzyme)